MCISDRVTTVENDGYSAVQVGFVDKKDKVVNKDASGKKAIGLGLSRYPLPKSLPSGEGCALRTPLGLSFH